VITSLTKEQEELVPTYLNKWLQVGYRVDTINRTKAEEAINFLYEKIMNIDKPKQVIFLDSPMACNMFLNLLDKNQLENQLENQLWNQLRNQLGNQLWNQLGNQLDNQLRNQLGNDYKLENYSIWENSYYWHYDFILNELFPEKISYFNIYLEYLKHSKELHYCYLYREIAILSDFPKTIKIDSSTKLHSEIGKALEYRDGYGFFANNGKIANSSLELELL
jgi:hypothetical protein